MPGVTPPTKTALMLQAAKNGNWEAVQQYLGQGVKSNATDAEGLTALHWAADSGSLETLNALLHAGADVTAKDIHGYAVLSYSHNPVVFARLIDAGADVNAQDMHGYTILHWHAQDIVKGHAIVALLLTKGVNVNIEDRWGRTALDCVKSHSVSCQNRKELKQKIIDLLEPHTPKRWSSNKWSLTLALTTTMIAALMVTSWIAVGAGVVVFGLGKRGFVRLNKVIRERVVIVGTPVTRSETISLKRPAGSVLPSIGLDVDSFTHILEDDLVLNVNLKETYSNN